MKTVCFFCVGRANWLDFRVDKIILDFSLGMKLIWLLCGRSKLTWFLNAGRKSLVVSVSTQVDLYFVWVVQIVLISVLGSNLTWFQCRMKWIRLCVGCRKWLHFSMVDRHWFGFCVAVENDLFLASGSKLTVFLWRGIAFDLMLEWGSKLTWFQWLVWFLCAGSKLTWF